MPRSNSELDYLTLALVPGIGRVRFDRLLAQFGSARAVLDAPPDSLRAVPGISRAAVTAVSGASRVRAQAIRERVRALGGEILVPDDARFPRRLREIPEAPTLLFAMGRIDLLARPAVAIVGSRAHTRYGADACRHFAAGAARAGAIVVSGMARGLDAIAHTAALDACGESVGVLGNGLGVVYPSANRRLYERMAQHGCLVTEFPPGERPNAGSFPRRNRLISGLAQLVLVVEARERSGALITVDTALGQGRDVLAVPGPITSPTSLGCNRLIQMGAKPALGLRDVLEEFGLPVATSPGVHLPTDLTEDERRVLTHLADGDRHVDDLAASLNAAPPHVMAVLTSLEIRGAVVQSPGKQFRRTSPAAG